MRSNNKKPPQTPLQKAIARLVDAYEKRHHLVLSGRMLSEMIGKSRNHISQIMNDGLVPSGEVLTDLARVLEATAEETDELLTAAMYTKLSQRTRDHFWLGEALRKTEILNERTAALEAFLQDTGQLDAFERWNKSGSKDGGKAKKKSTGSRSSPKKRKSAVKRKGKKR